jgi:hypothetical protein
MDRVKNPVREHGASSMEKAIYTWGLIANGRRWSANGRRWSASKTTWPFIPARGSEARWLFHVHAGKEKRLGLIRFFMP